MSSQHIITPGPYRATKLWNEVTRLFRAGMPVRKHRQHFRVHGSCFCASAAVDWLNELLRSNSNFGPEVSRQQTVQLLKKFLKNHVIEDVKGRWGSEELEDNGQLYRFPSSSPLKPLPLPCHAASVKKSFSLLDKDGFFKLRGAKSSKRLDREALENVDPSDQEVDQEAGLSEVRRRELTEDDVLEVWRDVTLTHLQKLLGLTALEDVLEPRHVNPQNIVYNMTRVNKHGVVTLDDKTDDLPHWVLSAMKCLANWPKSDSSQPSYPGFERDVFKTVSDYFISLPQPLLPYELYELFVNVLVLTGVLAAPRPHRGKRKSQAPPCRPPPAKTPHVGVAKTPFVGVAKTPQVGVAKTPQVGVAGGFVSTECLLLSLLRREACDEADSPMREVFGAGSRLAALRGGGVARRASQSGGSCLSLAQSESRGAAVGLHRPRSVSMETVVDAAGALPGPPLQLSHNSRQGNNNTPQNAPDGCQGDRAPSWNIPDDGRHGNDNTSQNAPGSSQGHATTSQNTPYSLHDNALPDCGSASQSQVSVGVSAPSGSSHSTLSLSLVPMATLSVSQRPRLQRPRSVGNYLDLIESRERSASCFSINAPVAEITVRPEVPGPPSSNRLGHAHLRASSLELRPRPLGHAHIRASSLELRPRPLGHAHLRASSLELRPRPAPRGPAGGRRCLSSTDLTTRPRPASSLTGPEPGPQPGPEPGPDRSGPECSGPSGALWSQTGSSRQPPVPLTSQPAQLSPHNSLLQPQAERLAVEAVQLCCLLLPPARRRKLQLLLRMMSRMSQNVDMPRLHHAIGTRTLMVHTFSGCVLSCSEEVDLDELLATRLVSFLLDHHQDILSVPLYLHHAVTDHLDYLRTVQIPYSSESCGEVAVPLHAFCRQISSREFEEQRLTVSQNAMAELLDMMLSDLSMGARERRKKLRLFQKQYPDIFSRRFPTAESQARVLEDKPRIKPPLLLSMKTRTFSIRN